MKKLLIALLFLPLIIQFSGCGPGSETSPGSCHPNVVENGLQMAMTQISSNTYSVQLCAPANPPGSFTVYAASSLSSLESQSVSMASIRSAHISDASESGPPFQITFLGSDKYFAIYHDSASGGFDNAVPLVNPREIIRQF